MSDEELGLKFLNRWDRLTVEEKRQELNVLRESFYWKTLPEELKRKIVRYFH